MSTWISTPTQKGLALQSKLLSTDKLEITRVVSGTGKVSTGQLSAQTAVSNIKQELTVESLTYGEDGKGLLRVRIDNFSLQTGYSMNQIGIYANDPDEGEILYIIAQVTDAAEPIPSITEQPTGFTCNWSFHLVFSDSSNISVTISPDAFITSKTADLRYAPLNNFCVCSQIRESSAAEASYTMIAPCEGFFLSTGRHIIVKYTVGYTLEKANYTLKLSVGNTTSKPLYYNGSEFPKSMLRSGSVYEFVYDGTNYNLVGGSIGIGVEGETLSVANGTSATAGRGAEIFNDYSNRSYEDDEGTIYAYGNVATGLYAHAEGRGTTASGNNSHAEGFSTKASSYAAHAEGQVTTASGPYSHAEGSGTTASGQNSHAEGDGTTASGKNSHTEGSGTTASGQNSHAEGNGTTASGSNSRAEGYYTSATGFCSHAAGYYNTANGYQAVFGKFADTSSSDDKGGLSGSAATTGSLFVIGNGTSLAAKANAFRVSASGKCYGSQSFGSSGADSGEFKEWLDGNPNAEDRMGLFVTLDGDFIKLATSEDDYILGVVSHPDVMSFVGNTASEEWCNKWKRDIFGRFLTEQKTIPEYTDENGIFHEETQVTVRILNPDWDSSQTYVPREERPEWDAICFEGQVIVVDDGTCKVNGYCSVSSNGKATASDSGYRVMKRIDDTHIKILFR